MKPAMQSNFPWWWILLMAGIILTGVLSAWWEWWRRRRAEGWPAAQGRIVSTFVRVRSGRRRSAYEAEIAYSFSVDGECNVGRYSETFASDDEAREYVRNLEGKPVAIRYNPERPESSLLLEQDLAPLLESRPPELRDQREAEEVQLRISRPLVGLFAGVAVAGLTLSLWAHVNALLGIVALPENWFMTLHAGAIVVWIPAVFVIDAPQHKRGKSWNALLSYCPIEMRYGVGALFVYALINFTIVWLRTESHKGLTALDWRGFSGHWMFFYAAGFAMLYSGLRLAAKTGATSSR